MLAQEDSNRAIEINTRDMLGADWDERLDVAKRGFAEAHGLDPTDLRTKVYEPDLFDLAAADS